MIKVNNLTKTYKSKKGAEVKALKGVSIEFNDRGLIFVLGKSGCGKSTLLNLIGGLDSPSGGEIVIDGKSSIDFKESDYDSYRNSCVGFVFQEYNLIEGKTVYDNISLALELQGKLANREEVEKVLKRLDLTDDNGKSLIDRQVNELSGGQKQRVAIARALVKSPKIILADEPTGALDSATGAALYGILKALSKDKLIIVVTHDKESAEKYGDRIIELKDGKVINDTGEKKPNEKVFTENESANAMLLKSRLPVKRSFQMGASGLKTKKFRLIVSMLLSVVAFVIFGFSITAAFVDENTTIIKKMYEYNHSMMIIESTAMEVIKDYHNGESGPYNMQHIPRPLSGQQLDIIKKYNSNAEPMWGTHSNDGAFGTVYAEYDLSFTDKLYSEWPGGYYYQIGLNNVIVELDPEFGAEYAALKPDSRFLNKNLSRLPQDFNEIAITDITADIFIRLGYKGGNEEKIDIKTPDDLIGKQAGEFTIVGVYSTDIDRIELEKLFLSGNDYDEEYLADIALGLRSSIAAHCFVKKGFLQSRAETFKPFNVLVKLSGDLRADRNLLRDLTYIDGDIIRTVEVKAMYSQLVYNAAGYNSMIIPAGLIGSAIFSIVAILLIMFFLNVSFDFKKKEIGILRALGARKKDITVICLIEILLITTINFVVSLAAVSIICAIINALFYVQVFIFGILQIFLLFLLCFGVSTIATILPILKITNKKPIDIINNK